MKARTHDVFSVGAGWYLLSLLSALSLDAMLVTIWLSLSVNFVIDAAGHSTGFSGRPSRTRLTHSVFTAPLWGGALGFGSAYLGAGLGFSSSDSYSMALWSLAGAVIALGHLLLDGLTQAGVYYWKRRMAIAHFSYDNPLLNAGFTVAGVVLALLAFLR